jgi:hypothetical protein
MLCPASWPSQACCWWLRIPFDLLDKVSVLGASHHRDRIFPLLLEMWQRLRVQILEDGLPRLWADCILIYTHCQSWWSWCKTLAACHCYSYWRWVFDTCVKQLITLKLKTTQGVLKNRMLKCPAGSHTL